MSGKEQFDLFDSNADGFVTRKELSLALYALGCNPTVKESEALAAQANPAEPDQISWQQFQAILRQEEERETRRTCVRVESQLWPACGHQDVPLEIRFAPSVDSPLERIETLAHTPRQHDSGVLLRCTVSDILSPSICSALASFSPRPTSLCAALVPLQSRRRDRTALLSNS